MSVLAQLSADELGTGQHVGPLVVAAELHVAAVLLEQHIEVIGLHQHVIELQEGQALLHSLLVALGGQHAVDGEVGADVSEEFHIVKVQQPVCVVDHHGLALAELNEAGHLLAEAVAVVLDGLHGHHLPEIGAAGGVADHAGAAAHQGDRPVSGHLQALHQAECHEMAYMQAVCGRVESDVKGCLAVVDHLTDLVLVGYLGYKAAGNQFFVNLHSSLPPEFIQDSPSARRRGLPVGDWT